MHVMMKRPLARNFIAVLSAFLIVGGCLCVLITSSRSARPAFAKSNIEKFYIEWQLPVKECCSVAYSNGGKFISVLCNDQLEVYNSSGVRKYISKIDDGTDAIVSPDGRYTLVFSRRNPSNTKLTILNGDGQVYWKTSVEGAVWSTDSCTSADGVGFAIGTGAGHVYVLEVGDGRKRYRRWRSPGAVVSINYFPSGKRVVLGTWQRSSILCATIRGSRLWESGAEQANLQNVQLLGSGDRLLLRSIPNRLGTDGAWSIIDSDGNDILREKLSGSNSASVISAPNGRYISLCYKKLIGHQTKSMYESHTALFDDSGRQLWDKGSSFFPARAMLVTSGGSVLLSGAKNALFVSSSSGEIKPSVKLPAGIIHCVPSPKGDSVLIYCKNKTLYKLTLSIQ